MKLIKLNGIDNHELVDKAATIINNGGIVVIPFDTVYGFVCDPYNETALKKLFGVKQRALNKTIGLAAMNLEQLEKTAKLDDINRNFMLDKIPGKFTFILENIDPKISDLCVQNGTIGIRIPDNDLVQEIIAKLGHVIAQTSANKNTLPNCFSIEDLTNQFDNDELEKIDLIIDGGVLLHKSASTIIDMTVFPPNIIERK